MESSDLMVHAEKLVKSYQLGKMTVPVLKEVSVSIRPKEFVSLLGPSGSGKSTLLNLLGGLDRPTGGMLTVDGKNLQKLSDGLMAQYRQHTVGMIFQSFNLLPQLTAEQNVLFPSLLAGDDEAASRVRAKALLERVSMWERRNHKPTELSGGEQQRIAIVRALLNQPKLLLADEPTGNLDSAHGQEIIKLLQEISQHDGLTVLLVTHDEALADLTQRQIRIKDGVIQNT